MKTLTEYFGTGEFSNRRAKIVQDDVGDYGVIYIIGEKEEYRVFPERAIYYVQDAADNWVTGIFSLKDLHEIY
jgi:hypothetical protein